MEQNLINRVGGIFDILIIFSNTMGTSQGKYNEILIRGMNKWLINQKS